MKIKKLKLLLVLGLVVWGLAIAASADDVAPMASGTCGDNLTWELSSEGILSIDGTGDMTDWGNKSAAPWYDYSADITEVVVGDEVTNIGSYSFYEYTELESVTIGNAVTVVGRNAFDGCIRLACATIPASMTSIEYRAFFRCYALMDVYYQGSMASWNSMDLSMRNVCLLTATIHYALQDDEEDGSQTEVTTVASGTCGEDLVWVLDSTGLLEISGTGCMEDWDSYSDVSWCRYANNITRVEIAEGVTSIGSNAFNGFYYLSSVVIPSTITRVGGDAFNGCIRLAQVYITDVAAWCSIQFEDLWSSPLYYFGALYVNGEVAREIVIPDGVSRIEDYAFSYHTWLTSVIIPDSVTSIGTYAFYWCTNLRSILLPNSVESIEGAAFSFNADFVFIETTDVYYAGTESEWAKIKTAETFNNITVHYADHDWDDGVTTQEATCADEGIITYTCESCGETKVEFISKPDHTAGNAVVENEVAATCTGNGSYDSVVYCTVCNAEISRETITVPATGHDYQAVVTEPTCTEQGYTTYTCSHCGGTYVDDCVNALGHDWEHGACAVCGATESEICSVSRCGSSLTVSVASEVPQNALLVVACYAEDKLISVRTVDVSLADGSYLVENVLFDGADTYVVYLLDATTYVPLCVQWDATA